MIKISKVVFDSAMVLHAGFLNSEDCTYSIDYSKKNYAKLGMSDDYSIEYRYFTPKKNTIFGIYTQQQPYLQAKLVNIVNGTGIIYIIDLRKKSPTYGKWESVQINAITHDLVYLPEGFAHAFLTTEDNTIIVLKQTKPNIKDHFKIINYKDPTINLDIPEGAKPYSRDIDVIDFKDLK